MRVRGIVAVEVHITKTSCDDKASDIAEKVKKMMKGTLNMSPAPSPRSSPALSDSTLEEGNNRQKILIRSFRVHNLLNYLNNRAYEQVQKEALCRRNLVCRIAQIQP